MQSDTRQLTSAIAAGNPGALTRFYNERFDRMLVEIQRATGRDKAFCLDAVQDAMLRIIRGMPVIEEEAALDAWVRRVTLSAALDRLRKESRLKKRERGAVKASTGEPEHLRQSDEERLAWLRERIAELDSGEAMLIRLRFGVGWTLARIGASLGLRPGAVDGRIGRIVRSMRERCGE